MCFYDEKQFCFCQQRITNCLNFDQNSNLNCSGENVCEHGGQCFQENSKCLKYFLCHCSDCYYEIKCELIMNGFSLSLDAILGYHTYPNRNIFNQPHGILIS